MQQDNKYPFSYPTHNNQVMSYNESYYRRLLAQCENCLNSYIKFLVPPQETSCQQLKNILALYDNEALWSENDEPNVQSMGQTEDKKKKSVKLPISPSKVCRFKEEAEEVPSYDDVVFLGEPEVDETRDEVDSVVYIPEPFQTSSISEKSTKFAFDSPPVYKTAFSRPAEEKSTFIFLPEPTQLGSTETTELNNEKLVTNPPKFFQKLSASPLAKAKLLTGKIEEKFSPTKSKLTPQSPLPQPMYMKQPSIIQRPKYTTQVSTVSQRSNTVSLYSCWPPPIGIIAISLLEVIFFLVNVKRPTDGRFSHGVIADALMFNPFRRKEAWRFLTYLFVHIGTQHLLFNLGVQVFLGVILEMVHQRWRVLTIYFAGILAGSLGTSVFNPRVKLAGASGGVYSLITAHIVTVILKWKQMSYPATQLLAFLIVIVTDLATGIHSLYQDKFVDISYIAHGCGALAGLLVGFPVLRKLSPDKQIRWFQYFGLVIYLVLILIAVIWNIAATSFFPQQEI